MGAGEITVIATVAGVYLVGAYVAAFISGYFDYEPASAGTIFWPVYVAAFLVIAALMPFVWLGLWIYQAGMWVRERR